MIAEHRDTFADLHTAAECGFEDDVLEPPETQPRLIHDLHVLRSKRVDQPGRKHGKFRCDEAGDR